LTEAVTASPTLSTAFAETPLPPGGHGVHLIAVLSLWSGPG
jgi:hypothetical protein